MKKDLRVSIEEKLLKQAKKEIPNLSGFFETCLKYYLGTEQVFFPTNDAQEILDKIKELQLQLFLLTEKEITEDKIAEAEQDKIDRFWRELYLKYRDTYVIPDDLKELAKELLDVDLDTLENILDSVDDNNLMFNTWTEAKQWYGDNQ